jgi:hypothetical protein
VASGDNYVDHKRNCNRCGTVMIQGWSLTCPACITNEKLEEQNRILSQQSSGGYSVGGGGFGGGYSDTAPPPYALYIVFSAIFLWILIGFLFFPHWGIVTFVSFLWTVFKLIISMALAIPLALYWMLF